MKNDIKKYLTLGAALAGSAFMVSCDDGDNVVDRTVSASAATAADFINTKQLNARLLLVTPDQVASDKLNYYFNETEYMSDDRKLRRETEVSIFIANAR